MRVGIVGLGAVGDRSARALAAAGYEVVACDVRPEAVAALSAVAAGAESPQAVAEAADLVIVAVFDDEQVREVLAGILAASTPPAVVVLQSTVPVETVLRAHDEAAARGVEVLDCGILGRVLAVGGDEAAVATARPVLEAITAIDETPVVHVGPLGAGMKAKLAWNLICYGNWYVAWESARLAEAAGVEPERMVELIDAAERWTRSTELLRAGPGARIQRVADYAHKDLRYALELAAELGLDLPGAGLVEASYDRVVGRSTPP